jgi:glycosyltransferase involved in cell wall biosynthesis
MPKLSVVIITFNEEKNIGRCLDSIQSIADDIVVVDSYSTDNTKEIAEKRGARFITHGFDGHIQQKNWAITQAKYPHVLSLDADEIPDEKLIQEIAHIKNDWIFDGYFFNRLNNYCGKWIKHSGWYPDKKLRLWDSRKGKWAGINPHDTFVLEEGASSKYIKGNLLHYSFRTVSEHILQINKFTDIGSKADFDRGKRSSLFKIYFFPKWRFIRDYIFKLGILDGYYGYIISKLSANTTFQKYVKIRELQRKGMKDQ